MGTKKGNHDNKQSRGANSRQEGREIWKTESGTEWQWSEEEGPLVDVQGSPAGDHYTGSPLDPQWLIWTLFSF